MTASLNLSCHCGTVRLRVKLAGGLDDVRRCDCSYCRMRGAVMASALYEDVEVMAGQDAIATYRFGTGVAEHHFCARCGIYTHHRRRSNPNECSVNVACIEGVSPFDFQEVLVNDGVRHPADNPSRARSVVGVLRYERLAKD